MITPEPVGDVATELVHVDPVDATVTRGELLATAFQFVPQLALVLGSTDASVQQIFAVVLDAVPVGDTASTGKVDADSEFAKGCDIPSPTSNVHSDVPPSLPALSTPYTEIACKPTPDVPSGIVKVSVVGYSFVAVPAALAKAAAWASNWYS